MPGSFGSGVIADLSAHFRLTTDPDSLASADHGLMHEQVAQEIEDIETAILTSTPWTPVLHCDSTDFARGTGGGGTSGQSWGRYRKLGDWVDAIGSIRTGSTGFVRGVGNYYAALPVPATIPGTQYPPVGSITVGSFISHYDLNAHAGTVGNATDANSMCFTYDDGELFWTDQGGTEHALPADTDSGGVLGDGSGYEHFRTGRNSGYQQVQQLTPLIHPSNIHFFLHYYCGPV